MLYVPLLSQHGSSQVTHFVSINRTGPTSLVVEFSLKVVMAFAYLWVCVCEHPITYWFIITNICSVRCLTF